RWRLARACAWWRCRTRARSTSIACGVRWIGLARAGNPGIYGFFVHPVVVVDAGSPSARREWRCATSSAPVCQRMGGGFSSRVQICAPAAPSRASSLAEHLAPLAAQVVVVQDREGDIYPIFTRRPEAV